MNEDTLIQAARRLSTDISPERDLWPAISKAIATPVPVRTVPLLAQAAAVVLLVSASSTVTYMTMKDRNQGPVVASPEMLFEQASFANRYTLGPGFQAARDALLADLDFELQRLSPASRQDIETNRGFIQRAIVDINKALEDQPENLFLQEQLLRAYREELLLLRRVGGLTRNIMMRNDI